MKIKICGMTQLDDALAALRYGADYLGFVFYAGSSRAVTSEQVRQITRHLPNETQTVGVFVDVTASAARVIADECRLTVIQLHGREHARDFHDFPLPVWRAVQFRDGDPFPSPDQWPAARYVADRRAEGAGHTGGTGLVTDWAAAARLAASVPVMLAGGLTPHNVAAAVAKVRPYGVDTAGGVEIPGKPGYKDHAIMRRFIEIARSYDDM